MSVGECMKEGGRGILDTVRGMRSLVMDQCTRVNMCRVSRRGVEGMSGRMVSFIRESGRRGLSMDRAYGGGQRGTRI